MREKGEKVEKEEKEAFEEKEEKEAFEEKGTPSRNSRPRKLRGRLKISAQPGPGLEPLTSKTLH